MRIDSFMGRLYERAPEKSPLTELMAVVPVFPGRQSGKNGLRFFCSFFLSRKDTPITKYRIVNRVRGIAAGIFLRHILEPRRKLYYEY